MNKTRIFIGAGAVLVLLLLVSMCSTKSGVETKAAKVSRGNLVVTVSASGTIHSSNEAKLSTVGSGRVSAIYVQENEAVKKGTLLLDLDSTPQTLKDYQRLQALGEKGYVTSQQVEQAKELWENSCISAPFSGTVAKRFVEPGEMLLGGTPALLLADLNSMILETNIDETDIGQVRPGQKAEVTLDAYKDLKLTGTVQFIAKSSLEVKEKGITYEVKIRLTPVDASLRLGMTGNVDIVITDKADVLMVPYSAVGEDKDLRYVFTVEKNRLKRKTITTGLENYDSAEVLGGLKEGETVVATYTTKLKDGQKIKPKY